MDGWFSGSMGGSGQITKNLINLDLIEIIQFCLKIYDLLRHPHLIFKQLYLGGCMDQWVGSGQMTNLIKFELINII